MHFIDGTITNSAVKLSSADFSNKDTPTETGGGLGFRYYFSSGWAFFTPYLAAYLLYYWLDWPPTHTGHTEGKGVAVWPLINIYWGLHAIHTVAAGLALVSWWRSPRRVCCKDWWLACVPWIGLALVLAIPGYYMEYPSDPWEHFTRINEWSDPLLIADHSTWRKWSYFLAYSLVGNLPASLQSFGLECFYTAGSLLLCWQYFLIARSVALERPRALLFVILQVLFFGNNLFTFYRYYGLASTLVAQLAAVAAVRIGLSAARQITAGPTVKSVRPLMTAAVSCALLLGLMRFSHVQAIIFTGMGWAAIALCAVVRWKPHLTWALAGGALILSIGVASRWPNGSDASSYFILTGWMTSWGAFNLFSPSSVATERTLQVLGILGVLNLGAAVALLRRHHVVGWLILMPIFVLTLPCLAIPFVQTLLRNGEGNMITNVLTFNRVLLGIPACLAIVVWCFDVDDHAKALRGRLRKWAFPTLVAVLTIVVAMPPSAPYYNRLWNALMIVPHDLSFHQLAKQGRESAPSAYISGGTPLLTTRAGGFVAHALGRRNIVDFARHRFLEPYHIPSDQVAALQLSLRAAANGCPPVQLWIPPVTEIYSAGSQAALLSHHWLQQHLALDHAGAPELRSLAKDLGWSEDRGTGQGYYIPPPATPTKR